MWRGDKVLVVAVLLLFYTSISTQVAPGDEDERCLTLNQNDAVDPTVTILMDSRNYIQLLEADGAVWDQRDFDNNNPTGAFTSTYFRHNAGGVCRWTVMSCGYRSGPQDNWLFTQYINKNAPPNTDYDVTLHVKLLYTLSNCRERHGCKPVMGVYIFNTTHPRDRDAYTNRNNYHLLTKISGASALTQTLNIKADIPPEYSGFYIAIHDDTSCIQLSQMKVFRHQCQMKQEGLVIFPETAAPVDTPLNVTTMCVPNSHFVTDPVVECQRTGRWSGSAECVCDPGFVKKRNSEGEFFCEPCPAGTYRSATDSQDRCKRCPANTAMDVVAAPMCQCLTGYFRNTEGLEDECPANQIFEDASYDCTQPPGKPHNVITSSMTATSLRLHWDHPIYLGRRLDLYYKVWISDPHNVGVMVMIHCEHICFHGTWCTITGLLPATQYVIRVTAHNGVSDQDLDGALARQNEITITTKIAPPSAPPRLLPFCDIIVWDAPTLPNGEITRYDVLFNFGDGSNTMVPVVGERNYYIMGIEVPEDTIEIKVRAVNEAGPGPFSNTSSMDCPADCPTVPVPTTAITQTITSTATRTATQTVTTTEIPSPTPCPTSSPTPDISAPVQYSPPGIVEDITVVGCCRVVWKPPQDMGGERPGYVIRFFNGDTYTASSFRRIFRSFEDVEMNFRMMEDCPTDMTVYADIRAKNSAGVSPFSEKVEVANPTTCGPSTTPSECPECDSCCEACPDCPTREPCPDPDPCPSCPTPPIVECPVVTCPACPTVTCPTDMPTDPTTDATSTTATPTNPTTDATTSTTAPTNPCPDPNRQPGDVRNVHTPSCGLIVWDAPDNVDGCNADLTYKIRLYSGITYGSTVSSEKTVISISTTSLRLSDHANVPDTRPLRAVVKARRSNGVHSQNWSDVIVVSESFDC